MAASGSPDRRPTPFDYYANSGRFRLGRAAAREYGLFQRDVYDEVARRFAAEGLSPALP
jgi:hypothetical protein